ncbi:MAG TPA: inorganic phosphate transporter [Bacteroidales bacterium]|nr:inorganic phosphate transporter [Bacteroidales bacterium]
METYYLIIVVVLFALAISDLVVGVSNDAVNFLNSAIGSKAAPFRIIVLVAALGVIVGATFSSGMMEVARKSIFNPDMFYFSEIMVVFLAVMMTDIILLDLFNTFALPTSTTVSIVFELLGSAVAVSIIKISKASQGIGELANYINSAKALGIISGIFISVIIAFSVGAIIQWIIRLFFSFRITKTIKYWGGIWGGIAISAISYFLLVKGVHGASFTSDAMNTWIKTNTNNIIIYSFLGGAFLFQLIVMFTRINILKIIVLFGTFALAMAFAGNDLVNFIGVPLAGFESFKAFMHANAEPGNYLMDILNGPVKTPTLILLIAGVIMSLTLRFSRKSRSVTATTVDLSRQSEGSERFESSALARFLVRWSVDASTFIRKYTPRRIQAFVERRFDQSLADSSSKKQKELMAFDLVRASVNLVVASILISTGTSLKLPLSTTYVTFMVAMGTSLSDGAWGRESAVYRITGMLTVVGGWFLTAITAFISAFLLATVIYYGGMVVIFALIVLAVFVVFRTHTIHKRRQQEYARTNTMASDELSTENVIHSCSETVTSIIIQVAKLYYMAVLNFSKEKRKELANIKKEARDLNKETKDLKNNVQYVIRKMEEDEIESGHHYVQVLDFLRETTNGLYYFIQPLFNHVDNNHPPLDKTQTEELLKFNEKMSEYFNYALTILKKNSFEHLDEFKKMRDELMEMTNDLRKKQVKTLKKAGKGTKVTLVYLDILSESKNMLLFVTNVMEAHQEFLALGSEGLSAKKTGL